jgi:hypothetical protein
VKNQGTGPTGSLWADAVYLSTNPTCCSAATLLTAWNLATPVPAGGAYTMTRTVTIPSVAAGSYYLIVRTDISGLIYEADEGNNTLARPITVTGPGPDLVPMAVTAPASVSTQEADPVSWTVKNQGTASASGAWTDTLYLSPSSTCCVSATSLASVSVSPGTPAGASYTQTQTVTIPNVAAGGYYLIISTDAGNTRAETDEGNNQLAVALAVTTPDLMPTALTAPPRGDSPAGGVRVLDGEEPRDGPRRLTVDGYALHLPELELLCERDQSQVGESGAGHGGGRDLYPDADGDDSEPARRGVRPVHQGRRERHALRGGRDEQ